MAATSPSSTLGSTTLSSETSLALTGDQAVRWVISATWEVGICRFRKPACTVIRSRVTTVRVCPLDQKLTQLNRAPQADSSGPQW